MNELVSVIIPTHNRRSLLRRALNSVLTQTYCHIEIIVIDDCSTDDTQALVQEYMKKHWTISYYRNSQKLGGGASRNRGLALASGRYVAFLDDDDEWFPEKLARQVPYADDYSIVGCLSLKSGQAALSGAPIGQTSKINLNLIFYNNGQLSPTVAMVRKDRLMCVGGFDESLAGAQGRDLFVRLVGAFGEAILINAPLARHHQEHTLNRITDSLGRYDGYWAEFHKNQRLMPVNLKQLRFFSLKIGEAAAQRSMAGVLGSFRYFPFNQYMFDGLRKAKACLAEVIYARFARSKQD